MQTDSHYIKFQKTRMPPSGMSSLSPKHHLFFFAIKQHAAAKQWHFEVKNWTMRSRTLKLRFDLSMER